MVGFTHRDKAEPIYRDWLQEMSEDALDRELRAAHDGLG